MESLRSAKPTLPLVSSQRVPLSHISHVDKYWSSAKLAENDIIRILHGVSIVLYMQLPDERCETIDFSSMSYQTEK